MTRSRPKPERLGRRHVVALPHRQHEPADDARKAGPADERQNRDDAEVDLVARQIHRKHRAKRDDQIERRDAEQQLGHPHDRGIDEAAEVAGDPAEQQPERERNRDADQADRQRDLRAVEQARQHVAPERIAAEQEHAARRIDAEEMDVRREKAQQLVRIAAHEEPHRQLARPVLFVRRSCSCRSRACRARTGRRLKLPSARTQCRLCGGWKYFARSISSCGYGATNGANSASR